MRIINDLRLAGRISKGVGRFLVDELRRGTFSENLSSLAWQREISEDMSWSDLLEEKRSRHPDKPLLVFDERVITCREMDDNANRLANYLLARGGGPGKGLGIMMNNSPEFLTAFIASQKIGMYSVPVNTSLRGDSLQYIIEHSDVTGMILDYEYLDTFLKIRDRLTRIQYVLVNTPDKNALLPDPSFMENFSVVFEESSKKPDARYNPSDICLILYTSGTTGMPKGVVYRYNRTNVKFYSIIAYALYRSSDILYTCLPLFHGNALFLTFTVGLHRGAMVVLAQKFSATRFWEDIRQYHVTSFNTIGAMIPILMKQPPRDTDLLNSARFTISAACPANDWEKFEKRFGIKIYEAYGAIDGGGKSISNLGNAPVGSVGKPSMGTRYRLVDENMNDVADGLPGELIFKASAAGKSVEYYKNEKATNTKIKKGWIFTGDLMKRDADGYLYFIGRNAEFMRIKGENVSAYEVEHRILQHPGVMEAAVFAVPSELAEDEIMAVISRVPGAALTEPQLIEALKENLPKFAIPRFVKIVNEFPKTGTQRIIKHKLQQSGLGGGVFDARQNTIAPLLNHPARGGRPVEQGDCI